MTFYIAAIALTVILYFVSVATGRMRKRVEADRAAWDSIMGMWHCEICEAHRLDAHVSVISFSIDGVPNFVRNVRYCNDRPECVAGAIAWKNAGTQIRPRYPLDGQGGGMEK